MVYFVRKRVIAITHSMFSLPLTTSNKMDSLLMNIDSSVIVITAAGSQIGTALALHFASMGAQIALVDVNQANLQRAYQACLTIHPHVRSFLLHAENEQALDDLFTDVITHFGSIDVLINNWFGENFPTLFSPSSVEQFCHSMHQLGVTFFSFGRQAASLMRAHNHQGVIINMAMETQQNSSSESTKAMIVGLTHSWAQELAEFNIRVGGVMPMCLRHNTDYSLSQNRERQQLQYEMVRSAEYILTNESFNGRMIEANYH